MEIRRRFIDIKKKLSTLILRDTEFLTFGSNEPMGGHLYLLNPEIPENDMLVFESANNVKLPEDYRIFLTSLSNGGAGPSFGLYDLETGINKAEELAFIHADSVPMSFSLDFPVKRSEVDNYIKYYLDCVDEGEDDLVERNKILEPLTGVIFLGEHGHGAHYFLVVKGELAGTVWYMGEGYIEPLFTGYHLWSFFDWYEAWLDTSLKALEIDEEKIVWDEKSKIIYFRHAGITKIPEEILACMDIRKLDLARNKFEVFPKELETFEHLRTLDLSENPFEEIGPHIEKLYTLKRLILKYSNLHDLPKEMSALKYLEELNLNYSNNLEILPNVLGEIQDLRKLSLSGCRNLKSLDGIGRLKKLEELNLRGSNVNDLPDSIGELSELKTLYIDETTITRLPESFEKLNNLRSLGLQIDTLDLAEAFTILLKLKKLENLYICNYTDMPPECADLKSLKYLEICERMDERDGGEDGFSLSENICNISSLEELILLNNRKINHLPECIAKLKKLRVLDIRTTRINHLPDSLAYLKNLEKIYVTINRHGSFGIPQYEADKLKSWFPFAEIKMH